MIDNIIKSRIKSIVINESPSAKVILFGSRTREDHDIESDWDVLILLDKEKVNIKEEQKFRHKLYDLELESGESISTIVHSLNDWNTRLSVTPLYESILKEGVYL